MEVPWQCGRCSLHNISASCAACGAPRPRQVDASEDYDDEHTEVSRLLGNVRPADSEPAQRANRELNRLAGARAWPPDPSGGRPGHANDANNNFLGEGGGGGGFNPAEIPQEFQGVGQQPAAQAQPARGPGFLPISGTQLHGTAVFPM